MKMTGEATLLTHQMTKSSSEAHVVPVLYHFFPHYRAGVNEALMKSQAYRYLFVGGRPIQSEDDGIKEWKVPKEANYLKIKNYYVGRALLQPSVLRLVLRNESKHIIFLAGAECASTWLAAPLARLAGKKVFFWTHGWTSHDVGVKRAIRSSFYRLADGLLLYGHQAKRIGIKMGFSPARMHVIYNSLDYPAQVAVRKGVTKEELLGIRQSLFGPRANDPLLICSGRLIPMRRLDLLLEAMRILKMANFPVNLILVGEGPEGETLRVKAQENGLNVCFYGACYEEPTLGRLFMAADLLVMPGRIGLAATHSLAYGTPVLIHNDPYDQGPEFESVIPGYNGACFEHNNSRDLAMVIMNWIRSHPKSEELRRRCYEVVERFYNPAAQVSQIERALDGKAADDSDWENFVSNRGGKKLGRTEAGSALAK